METGKSRIRQPASWQEVMQDLRAVAQIRGQRETVLPKVLTGGTAVLTPKVQTSEGQSRVLLREIS